MISEEVNFCPRCGTTLVAQVRINRSRPTCPACGWVFFPDPKVAVAVLVSHDGKVLLTRRANEPQRGYWSLPAGFMDAGEHPERAAERECLEETGLIVHVTRLLDIIPGQAHTRGADLLIVYLAEFLHGILKPGDDAERVDYFSINDLPPLAFASTLHILENWNIYENPQNRI
jgi:8-oxo-dGTP diphosphatase